MKTATKSTRCRKPGCGEQMVWHVNAIGQVTWTCEPCQLRKAGICRDCGGPLETTRHVRCARCGREQYLKTRRDSLARRLQHPPARKRRNLIKRRSRARHRDKDIARARAWRKTHPFVSDPFNRAYQRTWAANRRQDPKFVARKNKRRRYVAKLKRQGRWPIKAAA